MQARVNLPVDIEGDTPRRELESLAIFSVFLAGERVRDCIGWNLKEPILRERWRTFSLFLVTDFGRIVRSSRARESRTAEQQS